DVLLNHAQVDACRLRPSQGSHHLAMPVPQVGDERDLARIDEGALVDVSEQLGELRLSLRVRLAVPGALPADGLALAAVAAPDDLRSGSTLRRVLLGRPEGDPLWLPLAGARITALVDHERPAVPTPLDDAS